MSLRWQAWLWVMTNICKFVHAPGLPLSGLHTEAFGRCALQRCSLTGSRPGPVQLTTAFLRGLSCLEFAPFVQFLADQCGLELHGRHHVLCRPFCSHSSTVPAAVSVLQPQPFGFFAGSNRSVAMTFHFVQMESEEGSCSGSIF